MHPNTIKQIKPLMAEAASALIALETASTFDEIEVAWAAFIRPIGTVYNKLQEGAKSNGTSNAWFGRIKNARKTDELLAFVHHARNADEHGIRDRIKGLATEYRLNKLTRIGGANGFELTGITLDPGADIGDVEFHDGTNPPIIIPTSRFDKAQLIRVYDDKHKDHFDPPTTHLGRPVTDLSPLSVAQLAYAYWESVAAEAEARIDPTR